ncbi:restriction endonuclease subunit S [Rahnella variigena]|uniref:restriction endonuclease subunit S n=1 Tax=Rahnella variigena TaxID=574964 RepID=UPI003CE7AC6A
MSGRYKAYGEYKDSGVEWLGEIPGNWGYISISRMFTRIKRTGHIERELLSVYRDYGVIPKSSRDDNNNMPSEDLSPYQLVEINDLVMNKMKAWQGSIAISECEGIVSPAYFVYSPKLIFNDLALPKYIHYLLRNSIYITQYLSRSKGIRVNQWDLDPDEFKSIDVLLPTKEEQFQIATFLDHETAKIDTLIDKQQQLIELLKEKRQAVISHAVTKGLDPDVPMKDSGVEWLGDIPREWHSKSLKYLCSYNDEVISDSTLGDYEIEYVDIGSVSSSDGIIKVERMNFSNSPSRARRLVRDGDVIISTVRTYLEAISSVKNPPKNMVVSTGFSVIRPKVYLDKIFTSYCLRAKGFIGEIVSRSVGISYPAINASDLVSIQIPYFALKEQTQIAAFLDHETAKIDKLIDLQLLQIELLKERRTALISAAVTGKIDVRDWQVPVTQTESDEVMA